MKYLFLIITSLVLLPSLVLAADFRGRFVLNPIDNQAWYVRPDNKKIMVGSSGFSLFKLRSLSENISDQTWLALSSSTTSTLAVKMQGKLVSRESDHSLWYLNPADKKLVSLASPLALSSFLAKSAAQPTYSDFAKLHKPSMDEAIDQYSYYKHETITTANKKKFVVDSVMVDLSMPNLQIFSLAANKTECAKDCPARSVADFTASVKGFAAINGTYFDTAANKRNYTFFPLYDTKTGVLLNKAELKTWMTGPIVAFDEQNRFYYFTDSRYFLPAMIYDASGKIIITQGARSGKLVAALSSFPRLIENYNDVLIDWAMDPKQRDQRAMRNVLGYKDGKVFLIVAHNSTITDLTAVCISMGLEYALNLDGGYSTGLIYNHEYMLGPGRNVVNALVFSAK